MASSKQGVIALSNANIVDRTFDVFSNDYSDFVNLVVSRSSQPPLYPQPLFMRPPTAGEIAVFGNGINAGDLIAVVMFDLSAPGSSSRGNLSYVDLCALLMEEQYKNFAQGIAHDISVLHFKDLAPSGVVNELTRRLVVTPTGTVNSSSEYVILPALLAQNLTNQAPFAVGPDSVAAYQTSTRGKFAFFSPTPLKLTQGPASDDTGAFSAIVVVAKNLGTYTADQLSVKLTPMFAHYQTPELLTEMLKTVG